MNSPCIRHAILIGETAQLIRSSLERAGFRETEPADSLGQAVELARKGMHPMEICSALNEMRNRVHASFILDQLDYMQKGGRCSAVIALGGKLLRIKPCIAVQDGAMKMVEKREAMPDHNSHTAQADTRITKKLLSDQHSG